jgi:hypothetical protein
VPCQCRNSDPNSPLPPGADGCVVNPEAARRELAMQTETLRYLLTMPVLLSTQASLLLMPSSGERLLRSLAPGGDNTDLVLAHLDRTEDYVTPTTNKKENLNGYL